MYGKPRCFERNSGVYAQLIQELLFPVVPNVLDIVVIFHGVDELLHEKPSVSPGNSGKIQQN